MELYAHRVQELQHDLGLPISSFDDIGMSATGFLWELRSISCILAIKAMTWSDSCAITSSFIFATIFQRLI